MIYQNILLIGLSLVSPQQSFLVNLGNNFSQLASVSCEVPQGLFWDHSCF